MTINAMDPHTVRANHDRRLAREAAARKASSVLRYTTTTPTRRTPKEG